jgi:ADP-ribosylglycohydrolase
MRTALVSVIYPSSRLEDLTRDAYDCAAPTHGGQTTCAATAVAGAVSAALEGRPKVEVLSVALKASKEAEAFQPTEDVSTVTRAMETIYSNLTRRKNLVVDEVAHEYFPVKTLNIVPRTISLSSITESAEETVLFAANVGGDSDTVASIAGAIDRALYPETVNNEWFEVVSAINENSLLDVANSLAPLRPRG